MANIPIRDISLTGTPTASSAIVFDDGQMKRGTMAGSADAIRPVASQSEAEAGSDNAKTMTPLRAKQSIASEVGVSVQGYSANLVGFASKDVPDGDVVGTSDTQTLTGKTIDLADNTVTGTLAQFNAALSDSDFATLAGSETLTNKTLTAPAISSPTGIVKGDVGLGNVDNTSDATKWAATATLTNKTYDTAGTGNSFKINGSSALVTDADWTAVLNAMVGDSGSGGTKGLVPAPGAGDAAAGKYLAADGTFSVPAGSGGGGTAIEQVFDTRAAVLAATVDASVNAIFVQRYSTSTPFCPALYKRLGSTPSPVKAWHIQDASGAYFQLTGSVVYPEQLGAVGDNSTDDATAIANWTSYILTVGAQGFLSALFYKTSGNITLPDGTDPGGFKITGVGRDYCGFNYTGSSDFVYGPATGSNRHVGVVLQDFAIFGNNTGNCGINILNALDCDYLRLHIRGFTNDSIRFDGTVSYGALHCTVERCKTSPTTSNASLQSGSPAAVNVILSNYVTIEKNYFSGYIDGTNYLAYLVKSAGDSTKCRSNTFESATRCITTSGGSFLSDNDCPVGSTIQATTWFVVTANAQTTFNAPRGAVEANFDLSAVTALGNITITFENGGLRRNTATYSSVVSTIDVTGIDYIRLNFTGTITAFTGVMIGKLYVFKFLSGTTKLSRSNAIYAIGGADITPTANQTALFVGETSTVMRQVTAATTAS